jgi:hypothetical protein
MTGLRPPARGAAFPDDQTHGAYMTDTRFIYADVLDDPDLLRALATVGIRHTHLDHMLRMTIKTLTNVTPREALDATSVTGSAALRKRIWKLAKARLGDGPLLFDWRLSWNGANELRLAAMS